MEIIRNALQRDIHLKLLTSVALLVFGELLCIYAFQLNMGIFFIGIVLTVSGIIFTRNALLNRKVEETPLMRLLQKEPKQIVWVYYVVTRRMPFGLEFSKVATVYFKLINGDQITLSMSENNAAYVLKMLNLKLPHATFGFSQDREQWFMADPAMLYRENREGEEG